MASAFYFSTVMQTLHPKNVLQLNPVRISISNTTSYTADGKPPTKIVERHVSHTLIIAPQQTRQVILVEINVKNTSQKTNGELVSRSVQHFNLVILDGEETLYLFEPLESNQYSLEIQKAVEFQFPQHNIVMLKSVHPQSFDNYCMAYVGILADAILTQSVEIEVEEIAKEAFLNKEQALNTYLQKVKTKMPNLQQLPLGASAEYENNKGAIIGGVAGLLVLGPIGGLAGAGVGHLVDRKKIQ